MKKTADNVVHPTNDFNYQLILLKRQFEQQISKLEHRITMLEAQQHNEVSITTGSD